MHACRHCDLPIEHLDDIWTHIVGPGSRVRHCQDLRVALGRLAEPEHDHEWVEVTTVNDTERTYLCVTDTAHARTEPYPPAD